MSQVTIHPSDSPCMVLRGFKALSVRQDSKKLGKFLGKWNGETEAES